MIEMPAILITIMGSQPLKSVVCHCLIAWPHLSPSYTKQSLEQLINNNNTPVASSMVMPSFQ
jgi:hypothetical protein